MNKDEKTYWFRAGKLAFATGYTSAKSAWQDKYYRMPTHGPEYEIFVKGFEAVQAFINE